MSTPVTESEAERNEPIARPELCVITAWSAVSAFGVGAAPLRADYGAAAEPVSTAVGVDDWRAVLVPNFDIREELGRKGTRSLDRITGLTVTGVRGLLDEVGGRENVCAEDDIALVLGTDTGSIKSMMDFTRDSIVGDKPYHVDPSHFPNAVMNCPAGRSAIWYSLRGPNATVSAGRVAGLMALQYGSRLLRGGQADAVISGAAEECTLNRAWLERHIRGPQAAPVRLGEGCAVFLIEPAASAARGDRVALATVLSAEFAVTPPGVDAVTGMAACITAAMAASGARFDELAVAAVSGGAEGVEAAALARIGVPEESVLDVSKPLGDTGAAAAGFAIAGILVEVGVGMRRAGLSVVTAFDRDGGMGCVVMRVHAEAEAASL